MADFKVLITLDGSPLAEESLAYLPALARLGEVSLRLLSVVDETEEIHSLSTAEVVERERKVLTTYLHESASDIEKHFGLKAEIEVGVGVPAEVIQKRAAELSPNLLVITTHGRSGISRWRHGSVAAKVLQGATCSVLIVGPKAAEMAEWRTDAVSGFNSILVPLDGSSVAEQSLSTAASLARQIGSKVHLVRVVALQIAADPVGLGVSVDVTDQLQKTAAGYLLEMRSNFHVRDEVRTNVLVGAAATVLEDYMSSEKIDLVVMTSHGRSGIIRAALGSITDRLTGNGTAPVLVVRSVDITS